MLGKMKNLVTMFSAFDLFSRPSPLLNNSIILSHVMSMDTGDQQVPSSICGLSQWEKVFHV